MTDAGVTVVLLVSRRGRLGLVSTVSGIEVPSMALAPDDTLVEATGEVAASLGVTLEHTPRFVALLGRRDEQPVNSGFTLIFTAEAAHEPPPPTADGHEPRLTLFSWGALPESLSPLAATVVAACRDGAAVVDFDGAHVERATSTAPPPAPVPARASEHTKAAEAAAAPAPPVGRFRQALAGGAVCAGAALWIGGVLLALRVEHVIRRSTLEGLGPLLGLGAVVFGLVLAVRLRPQANPPSAVSTAFLALLTGFALLVAAVAFAAGVAVDDDRAAFWLWLCGAPTVLLGVRALRRHAGQGSPWSPGTPRALWGAALVGSLAIVFGPLREGLIEARQASSNQAQGDPRPKPRPDPFAHDQ